jgi:hypothetical protein
VCQFFFANRKAVHFRYKELFGIDEQVEQPDDEGVEDTTKVSPKEAAARYYFNLTYQISGEDITKFKQIETMSVYLVLNTASLIKDRLVKEKEEQKKLEQMYKNK